MASNYSFDVVSDFDRQELVNSIDQVRREISQRYDLKDVKTEIDLEQNELTIITDSDMALKSIEDVLRQKVIKRNLSIKIFDFQPVETSGGNRVKQRIILQKGLPQLVAKNLSKIIRDGVKKVNVSINGESLRVTGKSKDDLQNVIQILKDNEDDLSIPIQFENYR